MVKTSRKRQQTAALARPHAQAHHGEAHSLERAAPPSVSKKTTKESLTSIHRNFFDKLHQRQYAPQSLAASSHLSDTKIAKLEDLKKRRRLLASEVRTLKTCHFGTVAHESKCRRLAAEDVCQRRPYARNLPVMFDPSEYYQTGRSEKLQGATGQVSTLTTRIHGYRRQIKIRAAYQLLGTTLLQPRVHFDDEQDMLSLRIDVSIQGNYVACHYLFFELQFVDDAKNNSTTTLLQLQFKQHTLPKHAAYMDILVQQLGASLSLGPWQADRVDYNALVSNLQGCAEQLHRVCYAHAIRQEVLAFLRQSPSQIHGLQETHYSVEEIRTNAALDSISFILHLAADGPAQRPLGLHIKMLYKDPNQTLPTHVTIHHLHAPTSRPGSNARQADLRDVVSSDEDQIDGNARALLMFTESTFRKLPVPNAIPALVARMIILAQDAAAEDDESSV